VVAASMLLPAVARAEVSAVEVVRVAERDPKVVELRAAPGELTYGATKVDGEWEVSYYDGEERVALVVVDPRSGAVREAWTGYQVDWKMARGYEGAFGHRLNAPYVFLPLCALFLLGLVDWRRPWRPANLDLLVLLGFGVSHLFFNRAEIGVSVPLQYPVLLYLFARCLWVGLRGGDGLRPVWPASWLLIATLFLVGVRVGLNVADSGVIDVGYAGVVGADLIAHGAPLYGNFPAEVAHGNTYGPFNYLAYVPFEALWPWQGAWDDLPAAHGAAVVFDLATLALLYLLGLRIAGRPLAATLAFAWAAYPYTALALESNSNDALVALLLTATLLALAHPVGRGALLALATLTKLAPALLLPLLARHGPRAWQFLAAFAVTAAALLLWPVLDPGLSTLWDRTVGYQAGRDSPFSIWGQVPGLEPLRLVLLAGVCALAIVLALGPRRGTPRQVAALGAALLIGLQLTAEHWFYLYVVWFYPLVLVAFASPQPLSSTQNITIDDRGVGTDQEGGSRSA
jgi:Glycosyltransferase family 87